MKICARFWLPCFVVDRGHVISPQNNQKKCHVAFYNEIPPYFNDLVVLRLVLLVIIWWWMFLLFMFEREDWDDKFHNFFSSKASPCFPYLLSNFYASASLWTCIGWHGAMFGRGWFDNTNPNSCCWVSNWLLVWQIPSSFEVGVSCHNLKSWK